MSFDTERFIVEIQNRPCLWDSASKEYSDRNLKVKCWDEIVNLFKENEEITNAEKKQLAEALQKRWKSIRGCFTREVSRQKSLKSGSGGGSRKSEYIFFKQLQFLHRVVAIREPDSVESTADTVEESQQDRRNPPKRAKTTEKTASAEDDKFIEALNKSIESREKCDINSQDDDRLFMLSLVSTLKRVPVQRKMATKIQIMTLLDDATRTENSQGYHPQSWTNTQLDYPRQPERPTTSRNHHHRREGPEIPPTPTDYIAPLSNISEESSILDIYDY